MDPEWSILTSVTSQQQAKSPIPVWPEISTACQLGRTQRAKEVFSYDVKASDLNTEQDRNESLLNVEFLHSEKEKRVMEGTF